jgi:hypothetical protein
VMESVGHLRIVVRCRSADAMPWSAEAAPPL